MVSGMEDRMLVIYTVVVISTRYRRVWIRRDERGFIIDRQRWMVMMVRKKMLLQRLMEKIMLRSLQRKFFSIQFQWYFRIYTGNKQENIRFERYRLRMKTLVRDFRFLYFIRIYNIRLLFIKLRRNIRKYKMVVLKAVKVKVLFLYRKFLGS